MTGAFLPWSLDLTIRNLPHNRRLVLVAAFWAVGAVARPNSNGNRVALRRNVGVVQIIELVGLALVEHLGVTESQDIILAHREARCDEGVVLRGRIELELVVASNVTSAT